MVSFATGVGRKESGSQRRTWDLQSLGKAFSRKTQYDPSNYGVMVSRTWDLLKLSEVPRRDSPVNNVELLEEMSSSGTSS